MKPTGWASTPLQEENWTLSLADLEAIFDECEERGFNCRHFRRFVETGTFLGQTVVALSAHFDELHTIEVDSKLFEAAKLASWKAAHPIHFHLGHSAHVLEKILPRLMGPAVFYLDAHYSGSVTGGAFSEVPLLEELVVLERQFMHAGLVVIDDMDLFSKVNSFEMVSGKTGKSRGERASDWRAISCQSICRCFAPQRVQRSFPSRSGNRYILCLGATTSGKDSEPPQLNTACLTYGAACPDLAWRSYGASHWLSVPGHPLSLEGLRHLRAEGPWWSSIADAMEHEPRAEPTPPRLGSRELLASKTLRHRNSLGSSSTQFLEVVKQMSDARTVRVFSPCLSLDAGNNRLLPEPLDVPHNVSCAKTSDLSLFLRRHDPKRPTTADAGAKQHSSENKVREICRGPCWCTACALRAYRRN